MKPGLRLGYSGAKPGGTGRIRGSGRLGKPRGANPPRRPESVQLADYGKSGGALNPPSSCAIRRANSIVV